MNNLTFFGAFLGFIVGSVSTLAVGNVLPSEEPKLMEVTETCYASGCFEGDTAEKFKELEAKVNAIIDNLPEKERCRIQAKDMIFDVPDSNPHDGSVTFTTTPPKDHPCYKWLEKVQAVPERYKYP